ncbi:MAG TPA: Uma2 family endonuclease, partial [Gemmataceae bacterium]
PSSVAIEIAIGLREYAKREKHGKAYADGIGYALPAPLASSGRESFSPGASFYDGQFPLNPMRFIEGVPLLAVEVRSENDYGPS